MPQFFAVRNIPENLVGYGSPSGRSGEFRQLHLVLYYALAVPVLS